MFVSPVATLSEWTFSQINLALPGGCRYPGLVLTGIRAAAGSALQVTCPAVSGCVKIIPHPAGGSSSTLFEIQPLVANLAGLAGFRFGIPTVYVQLEGTVSGVDWTNYPLATTPEVLGSATAFSLFLAFPDRVARTLRQGSELGIAGTEKSEGWNAWAGSLAANVLLLDAAGRFYEEAMSFNVSGGAAPISYVAGSGVLPATPGSRLSVQAPAADSHFFWVKTEAAAGILTLSVSENEVEVSAGTQCLTLVDVHRWFAPQFENPLPRFTRGNRIVPLVNGPEFFEDLFGELRQVSGEGSFFFLTGYKIDPSAELTAAAETCRQLAQTIADSGGKCYFLPLKFFLMNPENEADINETVTIVVFVTSVVLLTAGVITVIATEGNANHSIEHFVAAGTPVALLLVEMGRGLLGGDGAGVRQLERKEINREATQLLNLPGANGGGSFCKYDPHPAIWSDNPPPRSRDFPFETIETFFYGAQVFHQKIAVLKKAGGQYVAYCGGIDLNPDRLDDETHQSASPYHDVQVRVEGPAVKDLAITFRDRWNRRETTNRISQEEIDRMTFPPASSPANLAQIARTYFKPNPDNVPTERAFSFAPNGDRTILDTTLRALRQAREFIYIEDQYFTPPEEYIRALLEAAPRVQSLIVVIPSTPDQPFGHLKRGDIIVNRLQPAFGNKLKIGFTQRQAVMLPDEINNGVGRLLLVQALAQTSTGTGEENLVMLELASNFRIPPAPFWLTINGELFFVKNAVGRTSAFNWERPQPTREEQERMDRETPGHFRYTASYNAIRMGNQEHRSGSAATVVRFDSIYMHSKLTIVDDVFACVGSANINRRGFYSDSEANVFMMPECMKHRSDNPVRQLRKRLWAEMLNLPFSIADAVLEDPIRAAAFFDRHPLSGNFFKPLDSVLPGINDGFSGALKASLSLAPNDFTNVDFDKALSLIDKIAVQALGGAFTAVADAVVGDTFFRQVSDPSSFLDPMLPTP